MARPSRWIGALALNLLVACLMAHAQSAGDLLKDARQALKSGKTEDALDLANKAIEQYPKDTDFLTFRASLFDRLGRFEKALDDYARLIRLDADGGEPYHGRGCIQFKLGKFADSVKDFDKYIEIKPARKASHWQRGISYYYAGKYEEGRRQFEGYQTYDSNDVENAVWRYMCMAKADGAAKARKEILKIGDDKRVPMRQVYDLFAGKLKPDDVLAAARVDNPPAEKLHHQLFYAHLYVGIYFDLEGDPKQAFTHLNKATEDYRIGHYMWDVARVHRDLLKKK